MEKWMSQYVKIRSNGQITLPAQTRREANISEGDWLEVLVEDDGSIRRVPKLTLDRTLAEEYQLSDIDWAVQQKDKKK